MTTKIERTRENLRATAVRLFAQFGYEATSVALIASTAGVSEMTFFRHFPSKESVLIDDPFDPEIGEAIARQPDMLPPFVRAVRGIRAVWSRLPDGAEEDLRTRLRIVASTPALHSALGKNSTATEAVIAEALSSGLISDRTSRVVAGAVLGALNAALLDWSMAEDESLSSAILGALDILEANHG